MRKFKISSPSTDLDANLKSKVDNKTKPIGSLGMLEDIAIKLGKVQNTLTPSVSQMQVLTFAADHGIVDEGVSPYPQEVSFQMVLNFLSGGAAINVFCDQHNIGLNVVDAGVKFDFEDHPSLIKAKVAYGTKNFAQETAMTEEECDQCIEKGAELVRDLHAKGCNIIGFGEMGIGNTTPAAAILSAITGKEAFDCSGAGTGLDDKGIQHKADVIKKALAKHNIDKNNPFEVLRTFGGLEIAMICGAFLQAAELKMLIVVDGFIVTSALLVAHAMHPEIVDYCIFSHQSNEKGHRLMLEHLKADSILNLGLRLGEGTGAALAYPIIKSAELFLNKMNSFEDAGVSNKDE